VSFLQLYRENERSFYWFTQHIQAVFHHSESSYQSKVACACPHLLFVPQQFKSQSLTTNAVMEQVFGDLATVPF
jgi:hypothetical protein